ncbi:hydroxyproline dehydrogenase-like [Mytilus edulis]|uniref:hydroxyproline dehydrogenase-like n=1 Tax=Mytilus edulis TaxID=6550 RepID=UPI0039EF267D
MRGLSLITQSNRITYSSTSMKPHLSAALQWLLKGNIHPISQQRFQHTMVGKIPKTGSTEDARSEIQFDDYKTVFEFKETPEILRALFVLKLCSFDGLVNNGEQLMKLSKRLLGNRLYTALQNKTVYGQFIGGNSLEELMVKVKILRMGGIGPLLAVPMEDDVGEQYDIEQMERQFDQNMIKTMECLDIVSNLNDKIPMMQVKLTALIPGDICTKLSTSCPNPSEGNKTVIEDIATFFRADKMPYIPNLTSTENMQLEAGLNRLKMVFRKGKQKDIWLMVDAEYTYMNPALNLITLAMMLNYNHDKPLVAYTYQNYLKGTEELLKRDIEYIKSHGVAFSAKLVRGAYMDKERMLSKKHEYPCPINNCYEDTSDTYHKSLEILFDETRRNKTKFKTVVASHNESTVLHAADRMKEFDIDKQDGSVVFGQVDGMGDQVSYALGRAGYLVYKSVPYGSIEDTLPYLLRRLLENRSVLNGVRRERELLRSALKHRLKQKYFPG